ncbi:orotate phosphoribosyltransferase [Legionella londiniensis]|uniref:Orotate phosphoribosyltransferase n=1 Tax=Legionella londiniensis TaxID=45068 RepID=A0A0W0VQK1_9GAMM|nr:orotate phosphoribosyltransferase [Legionella londiniensis]KTD22439.1 orotate phosphoribosyltransferase [Legionella londiniensis]STX92988.1 orotate phosphoribosyltransferase [Legionella londiniensis]
MNDVKDAFIKLAIESKALKFGSFQLKSGRNSPYFFNAGLFYDGTAIQKIGDFYAQIIMANQLDIQHLFGPAYKGIPLATATAVALAKLGLNVTVTFNRKETKSHGEGGNLIGAPLSGNTAIIDDVITAGTAFREAQKQIKENGGTLTSVLIALNRSERGESKLSAIQEIEQQNIKVFSIITFFDLIDYLKSEGEYAKVQEMLAYYDQYGCA